MSAGNLCCQTLPMSSCKEKLDLRKLPRFVAPFEDAQQCFGFRHLVAHM